MNQSKERKRNRRAFQLEGLEGRSLLSVSAFQPIPTVGTIVRRLKTPGPTRPVSIIQGRVTGTQATDGLYTGTPNPFVSYSGHGQANRFGEVLFGTTFLPTRIPTGTRTEAITRGTAVFNTLKGGNQLWAYFDGTGASSSDHTGVLNLRGVINSGTGRFLGATGTITLSGNVNGGRFALNYSIRFDKPV